MIVIPKHKECVDGLHTICPKAVEIAVAAIMIQ